MNEGAGGLAAVSIGLDPWLLLVGLLVVVVGGWKLLKLFWVIFR